MGEISEKNIRHELFSIQNLKEDDFVEFELPIDLYNTACRDCVFKNNGFCTGFCVKKFISGSP